MARTETVTRTIYSAEELQKANPAGFARAHARHCRWVHDDPAWLAEHRGSLTAALAAFGDPLPDRLDRDGDPRRTMAWVENNILAPLRMPRTGKRRNETRKYGHGYRPGNIIPCPWTGYCVDDDLLDVIKECARAGMPLRDIKRAVEDRAGQLWEAEVEDQCSEAYFIGEAEANGREFYENGDLA